MLIIFLTLFALLFVPVGAGGRWRRVRIEGESRNWSFILALTSTICSWLKILLF